ncbi:MAG: HupE/UreJ family protein [Bernardetiaceae bacterium]|nr:HupE/UreJ family protein [Bernardetiaceae bacterium]
MNDFTLYLKLGYEHISDVSGYDHILFVIALCAVYHWNKWRHILILVTAFTLGHSITLALTTLDYIPLNADIIEFLIPVSILATCLLNLAKPEAKVVNWKQMRGRYLLALGFGLIHGMGFANYLRALLIDSESLILPLFAFNVGLELGQLIIVAIALLAAFVAFKIGITQKQWNIGISVIVAAFALHLMYETWVF